LAPPSREPIHSGPEFAPYIHCTFFTQPYLLDFAKNFVIALEAAIGADFEGLSSAQKRRILVGPRADDAP
jgi:hypothetical protein